MALSTILCNHQPLSISRTFLSFQRETLYPVNSNSPFLSPLAPGDHSTFCLYEFAYSRYLI